MDFLSDNAAGVHPAVMAAMARAAGPSAKGYDADDWSARLDGAFGELFGAPCRVFAVPTGTAANALTLAALTPPWGAVLAERDAHVEVDEAGAIPFFTGGASLVLVEGEAGRLTPERLDAAMARRRGDVHQTEVAALTLTNATEVGTVYAPGAVAALGDWARARGLKLHMDGARFANAVAQLGCHPGDVTWRAGVAALSFGVVKTGGMNAEAVILFDDAHAEAFARRRKRAGMMPSKGRFAAAQLLAMVETGAWLDTARAANAGAARLADAVPERLLVPREANSVFLRLTAIERERLRGAGFSFYDWEVLGPDAARFVVRWDQDAAAIAALAEALRSL